MLTNVPKVDFLLVDILLLLLLNVKRKMSLTEMSVLIHQGQKTMYQSQHLNFSLNVYVSLVHLLYQKERGVDLVF